MVIKLISGILILFTAYMGITHGWKGLNVKPGDTGPEVDLFKKIDLSPGTVKIVAVLSILSSMLILLPQTFLAGNLINAAVILFLIGMFLNVREIKPALIEIPFLLIPLILIYLKHPFAVK